MSELHKFVFEGLPVRGMLVRLTDAWQDILRRRAEAGGYPAAVTELLGEMTAAAALMQANIKFNGSLTLQIMGDGPVKLAVAEVQPDLALRSTATVMGEVAADAPLSHMVNVTNQGRCAITLDPKDRQPGQQPYQGVVPLNGEHNEKLEHLSEVLEHYMLRSEQLDTKLVLAANGEVAAGLLIQRLPVKGEGNLEGQIDRDAARRIDAATRVQHGHRAVHGLHRAAGVIHQAGRAVLAMRHADDMAEFVQHHLDGAFDQALADQRQQFGRLPGLGGGAGGGARAGGCATFAAEHIEQHAVTDLEA